VHHWAERVNIVHWPSARRWHRVLCGGGLIWRQGALRGLGACLQGTSLTSTTPAVSLQPCGSPDWRRTMHMPTTRWRFFYATVEYACNAFAIGLVL
jgi:hypothetical protein